MTLDTETALTKEFQRELFELLKGFGKQGLNPGVMSGALAYYGTKLGLDVGAHPLKVMSNMLCSTDAAIDDYFDDDDDYFDDDDDYFDEDEVESAPEGITGGEEEEGRDQLETAANVLAFPLSKRLQ